MPLTDERLSEMIRMLPKCGIVADIGTDHGRLGAQLLLTGKCGKVWFSDISAPSLMETGRRITDERVVRAARRRYVLIRAEKGEAAYTERDLIVGPVLRKEPSKAFREYAAFRLRVAQKALAGAEKSGHSEKDALLTEMEYWREIVEC